MKLGLLITSIGNFGEKGFYNAQEIGLAKELDKLFDEVIVYKLIPKTEEFLSEKVVGCNHTTLNLIPANYLGINGFMDLNKLDTSIDALVYFSDTQLMVPKVYKWCKKNGVRLIPYIGVIESHSDNNLKKVLIDIMFKRNVSVYKKCTCMVKTPQVGMELKEHGVINCKVAPVGLDLSILHTEYVEAPVIELKTKWGFEASDKVLLFIGRLVPEKQPLKLIEIFEQIHKKNPAYKLLIVGTGVLHEEIENKVQEKNLSAFVKMIDKIPNVDIWELYRISKAFINLNQQEIFGMAILEAMYYECKVVAWEAPGPNFIIENSVSGVICKSNIDVVNATLKQDNKMVKEAHRRILDNFTWKTTANVIKELVKETR
ncbi:glycosyltransferase [Bacillus sp. OTU530]|uniref:glycosyltransferase n=1 Tax=Bacillus sp. OTU530 TaxID=3043862 RepID=UPI00313C352E